MQVIKNNFSQLRFCRVYKVKQSFLFHDERNTQSLYKKVLLYSYLQSKKEKKGHVITHGTNFQPDFCDIFC